MAIEPGSTDTDQKKDEEEDRWVVPGLAVPGGLLIGMGVGFLTDELMAGLFIGLGTGFIVMAVIMLLQKER